MLSTFTGTWGQTTADQELLGLIGILTLLVIVLSREIAAGTRTTFSERLDRILLVPIGPLLIAFVLTAAVHFRGILRL